LGSYLRERAHNLNHNKNIELPDNCNNMFFVFQNIDKSVRNLTGSTLIDNKGSNFSINTERREIAECKEKQHHLVCQINKDLIGDISELLVDIAEKSPEIGDYVQQHRATQSIMSKFDTMMKVSDQKVFLNNKFFDYFDNPYLKN
jgi:hypothetical protein